MDIMGKALDIQRPNPGLDKRAGNLNSCGRCADHLHPVPGDGVYEAGLRKDEERPRRIGVATLLDHAHALPSGR